MWRTLERQILDAFARLQDAFLSVIPALLVLLASLLVGVLTGVVLKLFLTLVFRIAAKRGRKAPAAAHGLLRAAGLTAGPEQLAGTASFWTAVVVALAVGVNALEPGGLKRTLSAVVAFLPLVLAATLLFLVGLGIAAVVRRSVLIAAVNAGLPWARFGARGLHAVIVASFAAAALDQLGVGRSILIAAFSIVVGGLVLALALAFGLGARDLARGWLERKLRAEEDDTGIRHV